MRNKRKRDKKLFCSMIEFEKEYFPKSYAEQLAATTKEKPSARGTGLAVEVLDTIRRKLRTQS